MNSPTDNPADVVRALADAGQALMDSFLHNLPAQGLDYAELVSALTGSAEQRGKLADLQARFYHEWLSLWHDASGTGDAQPAGRDRRFESREWRELPWFRLLHRSYLLNAAYLNGVAELAVLDPKKHKRLRFVTRQLVDAFAPTNFAPTNPEAIKTALETQGESLAQGLQQLSRDIERGRISMTDESAFEVGRNLALTPGDVVFENAVMQLIQYAPATERVYERPLLIVPPFINKYYILDLQPQNSFVRYSVEQGFTTFIVSWRNIPVELGTLGWEDYIEQGVFAPLDATTQITGSRTVNTLGFCVGGTLLTTALAALAAKRRKRAHSLTLLATMLDFSDTGDISVYVDQAYVERCEAEYRAGGLVPGSRLATTFATLRANDLVWTFVVNNYLMGREPRPFDLLYWNADGSNLPGPLYAFYLRNMYLENNLRVPGRLHLCGSSIDIGRIKLPAYVFAAREDHIVPWSSAYHSARLLGPRTEFVLGASGHVAGVVNPASLNRREFHTGGGPVRDPEQWLATAQRHPGSWWGHWSAWLAARSGEKKPSPSGSGSRKYPPIEPAPGRYVKERRN
ncbi:MAG TPA: class I poly(R)-hydroxyalkanoic acid synthase [Burkholderiales bacterium]|nr:class I poly(R)-hydroxyalkanoic acid synthase [Burkholderiales bacterium]